jgi:hypothetical protein
MSHRDSLLSISSDKIELVYKIFVEIYNNASSIANDIYNNNNNSSDTSKREIWKTTFLSLVTQNSELLENEKEYCKRRFIYLFELENVTYKYGEPKECNKCKLARYSDKFCENCICLHLQELFNTWTSGNDIIDKFIQECQKLSSIPRHIMEWIPFNQFKKVKFLTKGGFGSIYTAEWTRGHIFDYDESKKKYAYFGPERMVLKSLNDSNEPGKIFFDEVSSKFHLR